uniref:Beta/gamma crystallin 'Greek key' domain-containing protein n=1 Tax=Xenopus tropicalis TaxID=8364 RepID=A0A6I8QMT6_XENTR
MSKIELFEFRDMCGDSLSLSADTPDLALVGFLKRAQSLRVFGEPWIVFTDLKYQGHFVVYKEGSYNSIPSVSRLICSLRIVKGGLYEPKITLYEQANYGGRAQVLQKDADSLKPYGLYKLISSHKVEKGAWVIYDDDFFTGNAMVTIAGDTIPDYGKTGWRYKASSVKSIQHLGTTVDYVIWVTCLQYNEKGSTEPAPPELLQNVEIAQWQLLSFCFFLAMIAINILYMQWSAVCPWCEIIYR